MKNLVRKIIFFSCIFIACHMQLHSAFRPYELTPPLYSYQGDKQSFDYLYRQSCINTPHGRQLRHEASCCTYSLACCAASLAAATVCYNPALVTCCPIGYNSCNTALGAGCAAATTFPIASCCVLACMNSYNLNKNK